jgi:dihydropteroate synthase
MDEKGLTLVCNDRVLSFGTKTYIMGILNVTPDSFSDGGRYTALDAALKHAEDMIGAGVDIIDVGGESTRPFAQPVSVREELSRVVPVIEAIRRRWDVLLSIDTYKAEVAGAAVSAGADIVNDVTALRYDPAMVEVLLKHQVPAILMHMQGMPQDMQVRPYYDDVVGEVMAFLRERLAWAGKMGIDRDRFIIDPGIGFGKKADHNLMLLRSISAFQELGRPILIGPSRKSFIDKILDIDVGERDGATQAVVAVGVWEGAHIVRVHDVRSAVRTVRIVEAIRKGSVQHTALGTHQSTVSSR